MHAKSASRRGVAYRQQGQQDLDRTGGVLNSLTGECTAALRLPKECINCAKRRCLLVQACHPLCHVQALLLWS